MKYLLLLLFIGHVGSGQAQDNEKIAALKAQLSEATDTARVLLYSDLCYTYRFLAKDSAVLYGKRAIALARDISFKKGEAQGLNDLGIIYSDLNELDKAMALYQNSLSIRTQLNDSAGIASLYNKMGIAFQKKGELAQALEHQMTALNFYEKMKNPYGSAHCLNNVAIIYYNQGQPDEALNYYQQSLAIKKQIGDQHGIAGTLANIGNIYYSRKEFEQAIAMTDESIAYFRQLNAPEYLAAGLNNLGAMQRESNQFEAAEKAINESLQLRIQLNDSKGIASCYINLASLYMARQQTQQAKKYLSQSLAITRKQHLLMETRQAYVALKDLYRMENNFEQAALYYEKLISINDSIFSEASNQKILELKTQYETQKKEQEIELLSVANQLKATEIVQANNRFYASVGGTGLLLLCIFLFFNRYQHKQRALLAEEKANNQRLGFKSLIEGEEKERKRIARELHDGLGQLLSTARLNVSAMEDNIAEVVSRQWQNSIKLIDEAVTEVRHISHNMMPNALISIGFEAAVNEQVHIINDAGLVRVHAQMPEDKISLGESEAIALYRIIQEVLNNALKYAEAKNIWLTIENHDQLQISIRDDGKGFDTNLADTDGIGWKNIRSRMEILNGELKIFSELGKGAEISLKLAV